MPLTHVLEQPIQRQREEDEEHLTYQSAQGAKAEGEFVRAHVRGRRRGVAGGDQGRQVQQVEGARDCDREGSPSTARNARAIVRRIGRTP
jgi:hypothetical protein